MPYTPFTSWPAVIAHVQSGQPIYYQAPLDVHPVRVRCQLLGRVITSTDRTYNRVRVFPPSSDADPFLADGAHLDRFRARDNK